MIVTITRPYSPRPNITLQPGEHDLTQDEIERAERFGVIKKESPKNKQKEAPLTK